MNPIKLFGFAGSTYVRTARLVCAEEDVPYELAPLSFRSDSHRALHPFLKMPAMEHDGLHLFETLAIASYIDAIGAGPSLRLAGAREQALAMQWVSTAIDYLYDDLVGALLAESMPEGAKQKIDRDLCVLDAALQPGPFLAGDALSLADLFIAPIIDFAASKDAVFGSTPRANLERWWKTMASRASLKGTTP